MSYLPSIATSPHILLALITVPFNYKSLADEQLNSSFASRETHHFVQEAS